MKWTLGNRSWNASSAEPLRPMLTDAPEWFNRARVRTNGQSVFLPRVYKPQPVPLPRRAVTGGVPSAGFWPSQQSKMLLVLPVVALPFVFALGFCMHGMMIQSELATADADATGAVPPTAVLNEPVARVAERPAAAPAVEQIPPDQSKVAVAENPSPHVVTHHKPQLATVVPRKNGPSTWGIPPIANPSTEPADGFALRTAGQVRQVSAKAIRPAKAWFETATTDGACTTGACPRRSRGSIANSTRPWNGAPRRRRPPNRHKVKENWYF